MDQQDPSEQASSSMACSYPEDASAYVMYRSISCGFMAVVYPAYCTPRDSVVAIKIINSITCGNMDEWAAKLKVDTMAALTPQHPNILTPHSYFALNGHLRVVMPIVCQGSLLSILLRSFPKPLSLTCIATVLKSVLTALEILHGRGYCHRGVKPGNILVDEQGVVMLSDFRVSSWDYELEMMYRDPRVFRSSQNNMFFSKPYWVPPEALGHSDPHDSQSLKFDVWSVGITALELYHGLSPPISQYPGSSHAHHRILKRFQFLTDYRYP